MLLVMLLGMPGTSVVSQVGGKLNRVPMVSCQHLGGLPEPLLLRGCFEHLSLNSMEKGGKIMLLHSLVCGGIEPL